MSSLVSIRQRRDVIHLDITRDSRLQFVLSHEELQYETKYKFSRYSRNYEHSCERYDVTYRQTWEQ